MFKYVKPSFIQKNYDISGQTIRSWCDSNKIKSIRLPESGRRLIEYEDFLRYVGQEISTTTENTRRRICYARVSSSHQKEDLGRQIETLKEKYPENEIFQDIGSGLNWKRKHFQALLELVMSKSVEQVVVTHSDRLSRFSFELLQWMFNKFDCSIVVLNKVTDTNPEVEMAEDLLSVITYFTAKNNGLRAAKNRKNRSIAKQKDKTISDNSTKGNIETLVRG